MDYRNDLLSAYYSNLNGSIVVDGSVIEVGTKISDESTEFVRYFISGDDNVGTYDDIVREIDVNLDCVSIQPKNRGDDSITDSIVNQVKQIITNDFTITGWDIELTLDLGTEEASGENEANYISRRTITFKHFIWKQ